jgi:hypothetical protein
MPFAAASPFHHSRGEDSGYVLAFEVDLQSICGMDYSNPLILDGRMVLEANHVVKREFLTVWHPSAPPALSCLRVPCRMP